MEKLQILERILPGYAEKYLRNEYGPEDMPLLDAIADTFKQKVSGISFEKIYIVACQHMLEPQIRLFKKLVEIGIPAGNIYILPKAYSANESVMQELEALGCVVFRMALRFSINRSFDEFHHIQCTHLLHFVLNRVTDAEKMLILDDGGMLIQECCKNKPFMDTFKGKLFATEQTASGKNMLLNDELPILVDSVASSIEKIQIETGYIVRLCMERIREYFLEYSISKDAHILVIGLGPIGRTVLDCLTPLGYECCCYDKKLVKLNRKLNYFDVIIAATGSQSIKQSDLRKLKRGCHLISVSSSDREFPAPYLRSRAKGKVRIHDTFWNEQDDIYLANGGFPITFKGNRTECMPIEMDVTKMKLFESLLNHIIGTQKVDSSVNILYPDKWLLKRGVRKIYAALILMIALGIFMRIIYGWHNPQMTLIIGCISFTFCAIMWIPAIRWIRLYKRTEKMT